MKTFTHEDFFDFLEMTRMVQEVSEINWKSFEKSFLANIGWHPLLVPLFLASTWFQNLLTLLYEEAGVLGLFFCAFGYGILFLGSTFVLIRFLIMKDLQKKCSDRLFPMLYRGTHTQVFSNLSEKEKNAMRKIAPLLLQPFLKY